MLAGPRSLLRLRGLLLGRRKLILRLRSGLLERLQLRRDLVGARFEIAARRGQFVNGPPGLGEFLAGRLRLGRGFAKLRQLGAEYFQLRFQEVALRLRLLLAFLEPGGLLREPLRTRGVNAVAFGGEAPDLRLEPRAPLLRGTRAFLEQLRLLLQPFSGGDVVGHVSQRHLHRRLAQPGDVGKPDLQDQVGGALDAESDHAGRLPQGRVAQARFDALLKPTREQPPGARVHKEDLSGAVRDDDRLGKIFHQRSEVGGGFRRRLRRLVVPAFVGIHIRSAKKGRGARPVLVAAMVRLFRTMPIARCQSARGNPVAPALGEDASRRRATNTHNSRDERRLRHLAGLRLLRMRHISDNFKIPQESMEESQHAGELSI